MHGRLALIAELVFSLSGLSPTSASAQLSIARVPPSPPSSEASAEPRASPWVRDVIRNVSPGREPIVR